MKISRLLVQDFMRVKFVEIRPTEDVVRIHGNNAQGKTSLIRALESVLGGKSLHPEKPVREGAESATVEVDLDGIRIVVKWNASTGKAELKVESADGARYPKPQALLDGLLGKLSFDPQGFMALTPKEQVEILRKLIGADFSAIEGRREVAYLRRTTLGRDLDAAKAQAASIEAPPASTPDDLVSVEALLAESDAEHAKEAAFKDAEAAVVGASQTVASQTEDLEIAKDAVVAAERALEAAKRIREARAREKDNAIAIREAANLRRAQAVRGNVDDVRARLAGAEKINAAVKAKKARASREAKIVELTAAVAVCTKAIQIEDEAKLAAIREAKLPIAGLSFAGDEVLFGGLPLSQASHAEQLRISVALGIALNPKLRILLVRQGALLDSAAWDLLRAITKEKDMQIWIEDVGREGAGFLIEDGEVLESNESMGEKAGRG